MRTLSSRKSDPKEKSGSLPLLMSLMTPGRQLFVRNKTSDNLLKEVLQTQIPERQLNAAKRRVLPPLKYPTHIEKEYARFLLRLTDAMASATTGILLPELPRLLGKAQDKQPTFDGNQVIRADGLAEELEVTLGKMKARIARTLTEAELAKFLRTLASKAQRFNSEDVRRSVRSVINIDLVTQEPWLKDLMDGLVSKNVGLIQSVQEDYFKDITRRVLDAGFAGVRHEELAKDLKDRLEIPANRAKLIARDQVGTFNAQLTRFRQRELGIRKYKWVATKDERTREEHRERDGRVFYWEDFADNPRSAEVLPPGERPGEPINCRCSARPLIDDLISELQKR